MPAARKFALRLAAGIAFRLRVSRVVWQLAYPVPRTWDKERARESPSIGTTPSGDTFQRRARSGRAVSLLASAEALPAARCFSAGRGIILALGQDRNIRSESAQAILSGPWSSVSGVRPP